MRQWSAACCSSWWTTLRATPLHFSLRPAHLHNSERRDADGQDKRLKQFAANPALEMRVEGQLEQELGEESDPFSCEFLNADTDMLPSTLLIGSCRVAGSERLIVGKSQNIKYRCASGDEKRTQLISSASERALARFNIVST